MPVSEPAGWPFPATDAPSAVVVLDDHQRQCGRCRRVFTIADDVPSLGESKWWACAPCTASLLPTTRVP